MVGFTNEARIYLDEMATTRGSTFTNQVTFLLNQASHYTRPIKVTKKLVILAEETVKNYYKPNVDDYRDLYRTFVASGTSKGLARRLAKRSTRMYSLGKQLDPMKSTYQPTKIPLERTAKIHEMRTWSTPRRRQPTQRPRSAGFWLNAMRNAMIERRDTLDQLEEIERTFQEELGEEFEDINIHWASRTDQEDTTINWPWSREDFEEDDTGNNDTEDIEST